MKSLDPTQSAACAQFDKQSSRYGRSHILSDTADVADILEAVLPEKGTALDIATGGGHTAIFLAKAGWSVTASDVAPGMLAECGSLAAESGVAVTTNRHTAEELPYSDGSFDLVTCRVAAHHFSSPASFVSEAARVLRAGGHFLLIDGSVPDHAPVAERWIHQIERLRDPSHARFLPPAEWKDLCASAGLVVEQVTLTPFKQPDLEWYFATAATSSENRQTVRNLIATAPQEAVEAFSLQEEDGKIVWWWVRLALLARKP